MTIGCGLNVLNSRPSVCVKDLLPDIVNINLEQVLASILAKFSSNYQEFMLSMNSKSPFEPFLSRYYSFWLHSNELIKIRAANGTFDEVRILGLAENGLLAAQSTSTDQQHRLQPDGNSFDIFHGLIYAKN